MCNHQRMFHVDVCQTAFKPWMLEADRRGTFGPICKPCYPPVTGLHTEPAL